MLVCVAPQVWNYSVGYRASQPAFLPPPREAGFPDKECLSRTHDPDYQKLMDVFSAGRA
jgi:hypothetical protein